MLTVDNIARHVELSYIILLVDKALDAKPYSALNDLICSSKKVIISIGVTEKILGQ